MSFYEYLAFFDLALTCLIGSALFNMSATEFEQGTDKEFKSRLMTALYKKRNPLLNMLVALPIIVGFIGVIVLVAMPLKFIPYDEQLFQKYFMVAAIAGIVVGRVLRKHIWQRWLSRA